MKNNSVSITLDMESGKMQRKLRAITKHTEALADELREIDQDECPVCRSNDTSTETVRANGPGAGEVIYAATTITCNNCNVQTNKE